MATTRPIGADERIAEHKRRLRNDPQYLEEFLKETEIPKETEVTIEQLHAVYAMNGCEDELPCRNDLVTIIDRAHTDTQASLRDRVTGTLGFASMQHPNPDIKDQGYYLLRDLPSQYLLAKQSTDAPILSEEDALRMVKESPRTEFYAWVMVGAVEGIKECKGIRDVLKLGATSLAGLLAATWYAIMPSKRLAHIVQQGHAYEESEEGKKHFEAIKAQLDSVFAQYQD